MAYKQCNEKSSKFLASDFENCRSEAHEEISKIQIHAEQIKSSGEREEVAQEIKEVTEMHSKQMDAEDVRKTTEIIDNLISFQESEQVKELETTVKKSILKTIDGVHKATDAKEIAKSDVASRLRGSVEKLTDKISEDSNPEDENEQIYMREETVGIVVTKSKGEDTSFAVFGDKNDYTQTELRKNKSEPLLFSVKVPADSKESPVTAVLYDSPKFFPSPDTTVEDLTSLLSDRVTSPKKVPSKVVSMVTDIKYANISGKIEFDSEKSVEMTYNIEEEETRVYYKMRVEKKYECAYYNTSSLTWSKGSGSGCITSLEDGDRGEKFVTCRCDHMTSFAVLMSFDSDYHPIEETVTSILLGISFGCLVFTIIAYLPAKEMLKSRPVRLNLLLASSLIFSIASFYFMELAVMNEVKANRVPSDSDTASITCIIVAFLMNYFWLCQMAWMVCEALVMYRALVSAVMNSHIPKYMLKFNLACWGAPLIFPLIGVSWAGFDYANPKTCFLRRKYGLVTFYGPVVLCTVLNIFLFIRIAWSTFTKKSIDTGSTSLSEMEKQKKRLKFAITVMTLLGVGWMFGFFLIFLETNWIWIRWLFIVSNSTQGIFIFVLYVVLNDGLRKVWKKLLKLASKPNIYHSSAPSRIQGTGQAETHKTSLSDQPGKKTLDVTQGQQRLSVELVHHRPNSPDVQHRSHSPNVQHRSHSPNVRRRPYSPNVHVRPNRPHSSHSHDDSKSSDVALSSNTVSVHGETSREAEEILQI